MHISRRGLLIASASLAAPRLAHAQSAAAHDGFRILEPKPGRLALPEGKSAEVLGYDGAVSGPILRLKAGEELKARLSNGLDQPTSIHWRGVRGPNAMDGVAGLNQAPVAPGGTFDYRFTPPDAGTYLYHAHAEPFMAVQVARGLAGVLIVEEPRAPEVDADLVALVQDWSLDGAGAIVACASDGATPMLTVNGRAAPETLTQAPRARMRLRLVNASATRIMILAIDGATPTVIAIDGQPCGAFEPVRNTAPLGPGARFDIVFDMPEEGATVQLVQREPGGKDRPLFVFTSRGAAKPTRPPVESAPLNPLLPADIPLQRAKRLDLTLEQPAPGGDCAPALWRISGKLAPKDRPLFTVKRGGAVALGFINASPVNQVIRLHGHVMRQLHLLDDGWEPYWRDSVIVPVGRTVRVAFVADNPGRWRLASGNLAHASSGLVGFFEVA